MNFEANENEKKLCSKEKVAEFGEIQRKSKERAIGAKSGACCVLYRQARKEDSGDTHGGSVHTDERERERRVHPVWFI